MAEDFKPFLMQPTPFRVKQADNGTVHHFVLVRNDPASANAPSILGIFRRTDRHAMEQVAVVSLLKPEI